MPEVWTLITVRIITRRYNDRSSGEDTTWPSGGKAIEEWIPECSVKVTGMKRRGGSGIRL